jgi:hypothetical protein
MGTIEAIIVASAGEAPLTALATASQIHGKRLKIFNFSWDGGRLPFLDSPWLSHYGPRGFEGDRKPLNLLTTPQCRKSGR